MPATEIEVRGYRSIKALRLPLDPLTVIVGANGAGKTNLYRAFELLRAAAVGTLADEIAREGGLASVFWSGGRNLTEDGSFDPKYRTNGYRKQEKARLTLEARLDLDGFEPTYRIELGFPPPEATAAFPAEAQVKLESLTAPGKGKRTVALMERKGPALWVRDNDGNRQTLDDDLLASETALSTLRGAFPELDAVRGALTAWRFFHGFRTDLDAPLRRPTRAVTAPMLDADGSNLAAVFATLRHIRGDTTDLDAAIDTAFPGARLDVPLPDAHASFAMTFPDIPRRAFDAHELSDGTLQFLALMGALFAYRLPPFLALNEPETSLHPDLLPVLADSIVKASQRSQVWVVTHSTALADAIAQRSGVLPRAVERVESETRIREPDG